MILLCIVMALNAFLCNPLQQGLKLKSIIIISSSIPVYQPFPYNKDYNFRSDFITSNSSALHVIPLKQGLKL